MPNIFAATQPQPELEPQLAPEQTQGRVLTKAVVNVAHIMGLSQKQLGDVLGLSAATVSRMAKGAYLLEAGQKPWQLALQLVRLFRGLDSLTGGDEDSLRAWLRSPNADLHGVPLELLASVQGLVIAAEYVDGFRARV